MICLVKQITHENLLQHLSVFGFCFYSFFYHQGEKYHSALMDENKLYIYTVYLQLINN